MRRHLNTAVYKKKLKNKQTVASTLQEYPEDHCKNLHTIGTLCTIVSLRTSVSFKPWIATITTISRKAVCTSRSIWSKLPFRSFSSRNTYEKTKIILIKIFNENLSMLKWFHFGCFIFTKFVWFFS